MFLVVTNMGLRQKHLKMVSAPIQNISMRAESFLWAGALTPENYKPKNQEPILIETNPVNGKGILMNLITNFTILCPGPSLSLFSTKQKIIKEGKSCFIAVNGAILFDFVCDYWAVQDIEVFETALKLIINWKPFLFSTTLWIPERWLIDIPQDYDRLRESFNRFPIESFPSNKVEDFNNSMPFGKHINWRKYTLFMAIALAIKKGAQIIKLYGVDWSGKGYFKPKLENERTIHNEKRWNEEMQMFREIELECEKRGIKIIRM